MNSRINYAKTLFGLAGVFFLTAAVILGSQLAVQKQTAVNKAAAATVIYISPSSFEVMPGGEFNFKVLMDTNQNKVTGIDIPINFNPKAIKITSIEPGGGIGNLETIISNSFDNSSGSILYAAFTLNKQNAVSGSGIEILAIRGQALPDAPDGEFLLEFDPSVAVSATQESQNALTGTTNATLVIASPTPSPKPSPTQAPDTNQGTPNKCGGTCGSNINCIDSLVCYQGYCRNPSCTWANDCDCSKPTFTPTPAATKKPVSSSVIISKQDNPPTVKPVDELPETPASQPVDNTSDFWRTAYINQDPTPIGNIPSFEPNRIENKPQDNFIKWIVGSLVVGGVILIIAAIGILKYTGIIKPKKANIIRL